jgi:hypothetical protein
MQIWALKLQRWTSAQVIAETDSKQLVDLCRSRLSQRSEIMAIIADIQELSNSFSSFDLVYVNRKANLAAHCCAKEALTGRCSVLWESHHPHFLLHILQEDCNPLIE